MDWSDATRVCGFADERFGRSWMRPGNAWGIWCADRPNVRAQ
jgi:hypothetical protein